MQNAALKDFIKLQMLSNKGNILFKKPFGSSFHGLKSKVSISLRSTKKQNKTKTPNNKI